MGGFSQQIGDPNSGGKVQSFINQNKITTPTNSGQQQFGMPMQQPTGMAEGGQPQVQQQQFGMTMSLAQSLTTSQGTAMPQTTPQTPTGMRCGVGENAYPNTIGSMENTQIQPIPASMQAGKGKGA